MQICEPCKCTACMACFNSCGTNAVYTEECDNGELKILINKDKCINCGKCRRVCPSANTASLNKPIQVYAAYRNNSRYHDISSSGGICITLAEKIISMGGAVYGVANGGLPVHHFSKAETISEAKSFCGSKYVYAFPGKIYQDIEKELKTGRICLFTGTPCQVDGLRHYLKTDYENLFTVDVICHGTPPSTYLAQHIRHIKKGINKASVTFRGKKDYYMNIYDEDRNIIYSRRNDSDTYFYAFLKGLIFREVCYSCRYASIERTGDITVGDFRGLDKKALSGYKGKVSVLLINTNQGQRLFDMAKDSFIYEKRSIEEAAENNGQLKAPVKKHSDRDDFCSNYKSSRDFDTAIKNTNFYSKIKKNTVRNILLYFPRKIKKIF